MSTDGDTTSAASWDAVLDEYERALDHQESAVERTDVGTGVARLDVHVFVPPAGLEPLPERLRVRAEALEQRTTRLAERVRVLATAATPEPPSPRLRNRRGPTSAASLDLRA